MIEVLLAIGIFGLVMMAIYSSWSAILRGTRIGLAQAAEVQRTRVAVRALEESVSAAVMYSDNPRYYAFLSDTGNEFAYLSFVSRLPDSFPGSGLFPGQPVRRVTFFVDDQKNLKLTQQTLLDMSETPYTITLAPNTAAFAMEFFNPRTGEWLPEWVSTNSLPMLMRVALNFGGSKGQPPGEITIRSIPLNAFAISRAGASPQPGVPLNPGGGGGGGGRGRGGNRDPGGQSVFIGDESILQWNPNLPPNFRANSGNVTPPRAFEGRR
jgi:type II secretion system protein J